MVYYWQWGWPSSLSYWMNLGWLEKKKNKRYLKDDIKINKKDWGKFVKVDRDARNQKSNSKGGKIFRQGRKDLFYERKDISFVDYEEPVRPKLSRYEQLEQELFLFF